MVGDRAGRPGGADGRGQDRPSDVLELQRTWSSDDLDTVATAEDADPIWLRLQAAVNTLHQER